MIVPVVPPVVKVPGEPRVADGPLNWPRPTSKLPLVAAMPLPVASFTSPGLTVIV